MSYLCRTFARSLALWIGLVLVIDHAPASEIEKDFADSFASLDFITARVNLNQSYALAFKLYETMALGKLPGGRPKQGMYSGKDVAQILAGFDRIATGLGSPVAGVLAPDEKEIHEAFVRGFKNRTQNGDEGRMFQREEVLAWAKRNSAFLAKALQLSSLVNVIRVLSPETVRPPTSADVKDLELVSGGMIGIHHLYYISEALNSVALRPLIPARFDLASLRGEEARIRTEARKLFERSSANKYPWVDSSLRETERIFDAKLNAVLRTRTVGAVDELRSLAARAYYAADPNLTGACDRVREQLDTNTIATGNGNWKAMKTASGMPLAAGSDEMQILSMAYARGCFSKQSTVTARRILEDWANAHHDIGKRAAASHCTLAEWYRFGIGGSRDEATAVQWEERFTRETGGGHYCSSFVHKPLIDPADPWRVVQ